MKLHFPLKLATLFLSVLLPYQEVHEELYNGQRKIATYQGTASAFETGRRVNLRQADAEKIPEVTRKINKKITEFWRGTDSWWKWRDDPKSENGEEKDYWQSAEETIKRRGGDCDDYACLSIVKLSKLGFPARFILLYYSEQIEEDGKKPRVEESSHLVHLLEYKGKLYGASGVLPFLNHILPKYCSIDELVSHLLPEQERRIVIEARYKTFSADGVNLESGQDNKYELLKEREQKQEWKTIPLG